MKKHLSSARFLFALAIPALVLCSGCNKEDKAAAAGADAKGGDKIGVVDFNQVAASLSWNKDVETYTENLKNKLKLDFKQLEEKYVGEFEQKKKEFGLTDKDKPEDWAKKLSPSQSQELQQMGMNAQRIDQYLQGKGEQTLQSAQAQWKQNYLKAIDPLVRQVAAEKKLAVIVNHPGALLYYDPNVDVTTWVVDAWKKSPPTVAPPQLQPIEVPPSILASATQPSTQPTSSPKVP
jgi:Skp family chaperone for outer membrane proteins